MTLNASGPISLGGSTVGQSINLELGVSATALASINSNSFRTLAGVASGQISLSNFYGKSNAIPYWFASMSPSDNSQTVQSAVASSSRTQTVGGYTYVGGGGTGSFLTLAKFDATTGAQSFNFKYTLPNANYYNVPVFATDSSGNTYTMTTGQGSATFLYTKFNSSGAAVYSYAFNISNVSTYAYVRGMVVDSSGNQYVTVFSYNFSTTYRVHVLKFNSSGAYQWGIWYEAGYNIGVDIYAPVIASTGNILVPIVINSSTNGTGMLVVSPSGAVSSTYTFTWAGTTTGLQALDVDSSGNVFAIYGKYVAKLNSSFAVQWAVLGTAGTSSGQHPSIIGNNQGGCVYSYGDYNEYPLSCILGGLSSSGTSTFINRFTATLNTYNGNIFSGMSLYGSNIVFAGNCQVSLNSYVNNYNNITSAVGSFPADGTGYAAYLAGGTSYQYYSPTTGSVSASSLALTTVSRTFSSATQGTPTSMTPTITNLTSYPYSTVSGNVSSTTASQTYTLSGTYSWVCPTGVSSVSVVCVGGGGGGSGAPNGGDVSGGGGGGALAYANNIAVTAGSSYTVVVGAGGAGGGIYALNGQSGGDSSFNSTSVKAGGAQGGAYQSTGGGGTVKNGTGGAGGAGYFGAGGAGGYAGAGALGSLSGSGSGYSAAAGSGAGGGGGSSAAYGISSWVSSFGGGVGLGGKGGDGPGGSGGVYAQYPNNGGAGSYGINSSYGGGGAGGTSTFVFCAACPCGSYYEASAGSKGKGGAVRIVYPGSTRTFPSTNVGTP